MERSISTSIKKAETALRNKNFRKAELILKRINSKRNQINVHSLLLYTDALESQGKLEEAASACSKASRRAENPEEQGRLLNRSTDILYQQLGKFPSQEIEIVSQIIGYLEDILRLPPNPFSVVSRKKLCLIYLEKRSHDLLHYHAIHLRNHPDQEFEADQFLARACFLGDKRDEGLIYLTALEKNAESLNDNNLLKLLDLMLMYRCFDEAQNVINQNRLKRSAIGLDALQALVFFEKKEYFAAISILTETFIDSYFNNVQARTLYHARGKCLDATGNYSAAHAAFASMNSLAPHSNDSPDFTDFAAEYSKVDLMDLPAYSPVDSLQYVPVFMVGFPRSGTTLLESLLDTQKNIRILSERSNIAFITNSVNGKFRKSYPGDLPNLTEQEISRVREEYFKFNAEFLSKDENSPITVDKMPLNILHIPFLNMLFPSAKFIFSLRHPVDVCLSCFQQNFSINQEMRYFTDLERCFIRYRDVMESFERIRSKLDLCIHTVRYEELVNDANGVGSRLFDFLGLDEYEIYKDLHLRNRNKCIISPSASQVCEPLYDTSCNRWRNYEEIGRASCRERV